MESFEVFYAVRLNIYEIVIPPKPNQIFFYKRGTKTEFHLHTKWKPKPDNKKKLDSGIVSVMGMH